MRARFLALAVLTLASCAAPDSQTPSQVEPQASLAPAYEFVKPGEPSVDGVVIAPDGTPVEGAEILVQALVTSPMSRTVRARTGADGRFRVAAPHSMQFQLRVVTRTDPPHGFRHPVERVRVPAGGAHDLIVRLRAGSSISGRVVDEHGEPVARLALRTAVPEAMSSGAYVAAESVTAADGTFAFDGLADGFAGIVEQFPENSVPDALLVGVQRLRTGTTDLVVPRLPVTDVTGRVEDAEGRPVAGRTVVLARKDEPLVVEARTDTDGRFRARVVLPGSYVLRLRFPTRSGHADRDIGLIDASHGDERTFVAPENL